MLATSAVLLTFSNVTEYLQSEFGGYGGVGWATSGRLGGHFLVCVLTSESLAMLISEPWHDSREGFSFPTKDRFDIYCISLSADRLDAGSSGEVSVHWGRPQGFRGLLFPVPMTILIRR